MSEDQQHQQALAAIDATLEALLTDLTATDERGSRADTLAGLRQLRATIETLQRRSSHTESDSLTVQWTPTDNPPRRLIIDSSHHSEGWSHRRLEWDGSGWRPRSRESVDDVAIRAPSAIQQPILTDPPRLETLQERLRGTWAQPEPLALVFGATTTQDQAIVVAVDGDLRYRDRSDDRWYSISEPVLKHCLQQRGQPTLTPLSETPLERAQFVDRQENNPTTNSQP